MSILEKIISAGVGDVVTSVGDAIDKVVTSDEERLTLRNELKRIELEYKDKKEEREKQLDLAADEQATVRLQADMSSDNKWSKNIRPVSFAFSLGMFTLLTFTDGNVMEFTVKEAYINIWMYILLIMIGFYFSSRGLEKISDIISKIWTRK